MVAAAGANAQSLPGGPATGSGTLFVTGTVDSSIGLTIESAGGTTVTGLTTNAVTSDLGTVTKFGAAPTGFTITRGASSWTLTSAVGVKVSKANLGSSDYTLTAQLSNAAPSGITWKLNGSTLSDAAATTLATQGTYGATATYSWNIVVLDSAIATSIDNEIAFFASSN